MTGIEKLIEMAGGQRALGRALGFPQSDIFTWKTKGCVPAKHLELIVQKFDIDPITLADPRITKFYKGA